MSIYKLIVRSSETSYSKTGEFGRFDSDKEAWEKLSERIKKDEFVILHKRVKNEVPVNNQKRYVNAFNEKFNNPIVLYKTRPVEVNDMVPILEGIAGDPYLPVNSKLVEDKPERKSLVGYGYKLRLRVYVGDVVESNIINNIDNEIDAFNIIYSLEKQHQFLIKNNLINSENAEYFGVLVEMLKINGIGVEEWVDYWNSELCLRWNEYAEKYLQKKND